ncbi:class I SAM-dependent methyltransferase [Metabacillus iocasae]|uniref:Site-specific DNA-methyltransferase (Adenine-specific) n=1 Tax=Priestia iocasae TaxID=2291674 RepID=A0ABS2QP85_9BACI|nr:class I SAM-dependent methyltransferase [Metabacillus iocasae]MBM7701210.1 site-specific DNA-methyltransferase (adenine-specific) [Metabacillus iocasae]
MSHLTEMEKVFSAIDQTAIILRKELNCLYLEAIAETGENMFHGEILQDELDEVTKKRLEREYESINLEKIDGETIRKAYQLAILKGMKEAVQPNHQMTPDAVSLFVSYLIGKFMEGKSNYNLLDPAVGAGNLLTTILNHHHQLIDAAYGIDVDDLLIKLTYVNANLQKHGVQLFNQDSLQPLFIDPVDLVVCDLPVGYYPNDEGAKAYQVRAEEGHSYAHHLFIEQSLNHMKDGAYGIFLVPNNLFETEQAKSLHAFLKEVAVIQGLIQLPLSMFKQESMAKSIFIIQKKGEGVVTPKQALLVQLPKFSNREAMNDMMTQMNEWFRNC